MRGALAALSLAASGCGQILGIGDPSLDPAGGVGATGGGHGGGSVGHGGSGATGATGEGGGGGSEVPKPCAPTNSICNTVKSDCIALVDNSASTEFALRVAQVTIYKPNAFAGGLEQATILNSVTLNLADCNLKGSGTMSWLVTFDLTSGMGKVGAAKPEADPFGGYAFVQETLMSGGLPFDVQPSQFTASVDADGLVTASAIDYALLPIYLDSAATTFILMPVRKAQLYETTISTDRNCIGHYNAEGLEPAKGCLPDASHPAFIDGGKLQGHILLEDADQVVVTAFGLNRSLCVILSDAPAIFSDGGSPAHCKRNGDGSIKFPGDWCSKTNQGADATCYDASQFNLGFAASAAKQK